MLEAIIPNKKQDHKRPASLLPEKDHPLITTKEVTGSPQQRVCQTMTESIVTVIMSPPRIGHTNEQVVPREVKSPKGDRRSECTMPSPKKPLSNGGNNFIPYPSGWEFPHLSYLQDNLGLLLKGNPLKLLQLAAMLDTIRNIEQFQMRETSQKEG